MPCLSIPKWYLNLFIDILANDLKDSNVIFLLDEPGVYLHVNAQRELLRLFYDLCKKYGVELSDKYSEPMIKVNGEIIPLREYDFEEKCEKLKEKYR